MSLSTECAAAFLSLRYPSIDKHESALTFTDAQNEVELILARARLLSPPQNIDKLKICPHHRETLGLGWKRSSTRCTVGLFSLFYTRRMEYLRCRMIRTFFSFD